MTFEEIAPVFKKPTKAEMREYNLKKKILIRIDELKQSDHLKYINEFYPSWIVINELENLIK